MRCSPLRTGGPDYSIILYDSVLGSGRLDYCGGFGWFLDLSSVVISSGNLKKFSVYWVGFQTNEEQSKICIPFFDIGCIVCMYWMYPKPSSSYCMELNGDGRGQRGMAFLLLTMCGRIHFLLLACGQLSCNLQK